MQITFLYSIFPFPACFIFVFDNGDWWESCPSEFILSNLDDVCYGKTHTHTHTHTYIYILYTYRLDNTSTIFG